MGKPRTFDKVRGRYFDAPPHPCSARPASRSEAGEERGFTGCGVNERRGRKERKDLIDPDLRRSEFDIYDHLEND